MGIVGRKRWVSRGFVVAIPRVGLDRRDPDFAPKFTPIYPPIATEARSDPVSLVTTTQNQGLPLKPQDKSRRGEGEIFFPHPLVLGIRDRGSDCQGHGA